MKHFLESFTPELRQRIQAALGSLGILAVAFGFGTDGIWEQILVLTGAALQFLASIANIANLRGVNDIWKVIRGAVYTLGFTVSPALVVLGVYGDDLNQQILMGLSLGLSALSSFIAIFTAGKQATNARVDAARQSAADAAVVSVLTAPVDQQILSLQEAAARIGVPAESLRRDDYRDAHDA